MRKSVARNICFCGLLTAFAVIFQSAPVFWPMAGMLLSPLSTFPVALAAIVSRSAGIASYAASGMILLAIYPQEAYIFFWATGILGLTAGLHYKSHFAKSIPFAGGVLFGGINALAYLLGISLFGELSAGASFTDTLLPFAVFSLGYAAVCVLIIKYLAKTLIRLGIKFTGQDGPSIKNKNADRK